MSTLSKLVYREIDADDDMGALTTLIHAAYAPHAAKGLRYWGTHQTVEDTIKRYAAGIGIIGLVLGRVVATITLRKSNEASEVELYRDPTTWTFGQFAVHPDFKGMGVGKQLHDFALDYAYARGCRRIALDTAAQAEALISLYRAWGYSIVGTCDWRPLTNYQSVVMAKQLTASQKAHAV